MNTKHPTAQQEINADFDASVASVMRDVRRWAKDNGMTVAAAWPSLMSRIGRCYSERVKRYAHTQLGLDTTGGAR